MSVPAFTQGPWRVEITPRDQTWPGRYQIECDVLTFGMDGEEGIYCDNPADARLIAAAPEMYLALARLSNEVLGSLGLEPEAIRRAIGNTNFAALEQRATEARALLARIDGAA